MQNSAAQFPSMVRRILHSLDLYVTLIAAITLGVLGTIGTASEKVVTSGILVTLAVAAFSLLRIRSQGEQIDKSLADIMNSQSSADKFFSDVDDGDEIKRMISTSREVWLHGWTLELHLVSYAEEIREAVTNGLHIKILVIKPHSTAMEIAASEADNRSASELSVNLESNIRRLAARVPGTASGKLEVRTLDHVPHYTVFASDPASDQGKIIMRIATFRANHWRRPTFTVTQQYDAAWHEFFKSQFEAKWNSAHPYTSRP